MLVNRANLGASRLLDHSTSRSSHGTIETIEVPVVPAHHLLKLSGLQEVDLIKIDVEGHEARVLAGLEPVLRIQRPRAILFEHLGDLADPSSSIRRLFDRLDYQIWGISKSLTKWSLVSHAALPTHRRRPTDYLAVAPSRLSLSETRVLRSRVARVEQDGR